MKIYGNKIRNLRKLKGLTQEEIAKKLDTTMATVSKWELEQTSPRGDKLSKLAKLFDVPVSAISDINDNVTKDGIIEQLPIDVRNIIYKYNLLSAEEKLEINCLIDEKIREFGKMKK